MFHNANDTVRYEPKRAGPTSQPAAQRASDSRSRQTPPLVSWQETATARVVAPPNANAAFLSTTVLFYSEKISGIVLSWLHEANYQLWWGILRLGAYLLTLVIIFFICSSFNPLKSNTLKTRQREKKVGVMRDRDGNIKITALFVPSCTRSSF